MGWLGHLSYDSVIENSVRAERCPFSMRWTLSPPQHALLRRGEEESLSDRPRVWNVENQGIHDLATGAVGVFPSRCVLPGAEGKQIFQNQGQKAAQP